jgi:serine/threonine protein kinase
MFIKPGLGCFSGERHSVAADKEKREYRTDRVKLGRLRAQYALTIEQFWAKAAMDAGTAKKMFHGGPVSLKTLAKAAKVFGVTDHLELLHPDELRELGVDPSLTFSSRHVQEWEIERFLSPWERTANGLQFCVAKMRHRFLETRFARGKCYWLRHLQVKERQRLAKELSRHPDVCELIGKDEHIAQNLTATFVEDGGLWWVLDRWEEGPTLAERLKEGPLDGAATRTVMTGVAEGLRALHKAKVVRRELAPRFIILHADLCPVLTDFELAKLLEGKTVAPKEGWQDDPYRAIEVAGEGVVDERADLYSWGRIFVEAASGSLPAKGKENAAVTRLPCPDHVKDVVLRCLAPTRSSRPSAMDEVLKAMKRWTS